jgi:hypothetical protein
VWINKPRALTPIEQQRLTERFAEQVVLWTIADLERRLASEDVYERLGISAVLRRALVDPKRAAVPLALKRLDLPAPVFEFTPLAHDKEGSTEGWKRILGFAGPRLAEPTSKATLRQFLQAPAAAHRGKAVSVENVIKYFANVFGGVHIGVPHNEFESFVQQLSLASPKILDIWCGNLCAMATVTLRALMPMRDPLTTYSQLPDWARLNVADGPDRYSHEDPRPCAICGSAVQELLMSVEDNPAEATRFRVVMRSCTDPGCPSNAGDQRLNDAV